MTKLTLIAAAATIGAIIAGAALPPRADTEYPWCAQYRRAIGATNCGFVTYQQCLATISGVGGMCYRNPAYRPPRGRKPRDG
jgi:Protein of unknown function (DUF3551)